MTKFLPPNTTNSGTWKKPTWPIFVGIDFGSEEVSVEAVFDTWTREFISIKEIKRVAKP